MNALATPDVTAAQLIAAVGSIIGLLVSQGLIDNQTEKLVTGIASIVIPIVWVAADALIRHGRSRTLLYPPKGAVEEKDGQ